MRARVRTWSVNDFFREDYAPDDPMDDEAAIRLMVGPVGRLAEESVTVTISTPTRLGRTLTSWGCPVFGRHRVIVEPMSVGPVIRYLTARVEALRADTWDELGAGLSRIGRWELEDYRDQSGPDDVHSPWRRAELRSWAVIRAHPEANPVAPAEGQRLWLRLRIGPAGESDSEPLPFDVCVCEPAWLSRQIREHGPLVDGADHLFVRDLNLRDVTAFLSGPDGHHRRLVQHDALALGIDQGVGRSQVDGQVVRKVFLDETEHDDTSLYVSEMAEGSYRYTSAHVRPWVRSGTAGRWPVVNVSFALQAYHRLGPLRAAGLFKFLVPERGAVPSARFRQGIPDVTHVRRHFTSRRTRPHPAG